VTYKENIEMEKKNRIERNRKKIEEKKKENKE